MNDAALPSDVEDSAEVVEFQKGAGPGGAGATTAMEHTAAVS